MYGKNLRYRIITKGVKTLAQDLFHFIMWMSITLVVLFFIVIISIFIYKKSAVLDGYINVQGIKYHLEKEVN